MQKVDTYKASRNPVSPLDPHDVATDRPLQRPVLIVSLASHREQGWFCSQVTAQHSAPAPWSPTQTGLCARNRSRLPPEQKCWMLATGCELHEPSVTPGHASGCLTLAQGGGMDLPWERKMKLKISLITGFSQVARELRREMEAESS